MGLSVDSAIRMVVEINRNEIERRFRNATMLRRNFERIAAEQESFTNQVSRALAERERLINQVSSSIAADGEKLRKLALCVNWQPALLFTSSPTRAKKLQEPQKINRNTADPVLHFILNPVRKFLAG